MVVRAAAGGAASTPGSSAAAWLRNINRRFPGAGCGEFGQDRPVGDAERKQARKEGRDLPALGALEGNGIREVAQGRSSPLGWVTCACTCSASARGLHPTALQPLLLPPPAQPRNPDLHSPAWACERLPQPSSRPGNGPAPGHLG
ncbi:uncharacterized protein LOC115612953 isoform X2 [Strigops habroptila]|uniref:uncharacterized protein LOC115612953 isoform X2 n=1 Tax=Strigops habroptila TaxID=2489341 RepID=UPI0011CEDCAB|nr:uncharacterized protein LOC115612953 isoform X2 [Strigops habroptila]